MSRFLQRLQNREHQPRATRIRPARTSLFDSAPTSEMENEASQRQPSRPPSPSLPPSLTQTGSPVDVEPSEADASRPREQDLAQLRASLDALREIRGEAQRPSPVIQPSFKDSLSKQPETRHESASDKAGTAPASAAPPRKPSPSRRAEAAEGEIPPDTLDRRETSSPEAEKFGEQETTHARPADATSVWERLLQRIEENKPRSDTQPESHDAPRTRDRNSERSDISPTENVSSAQEKWRRKPDSAPVEISIGTIEIRTPAPAPTPPRTRPASSPTQPASSALEKYYQRRLEELP